MLVPDIATVPLPVNDLAATTSWPGADTSGLRRPSRVGPELENRDNGSFAT
jgi:hypothetical protein